MSHVQVASWLASCDLSSNKMAFDSKTDSKRHHRLLKQIIQSVHCFLLH